MLTALIIQRRIKSAKKQRESILAEIATRELDLLIEKPESLNYFFASAALHNLLQPELKRTDELIEELEQRLHR
jgi:hypothetical protein